MAGKGRRAVKEAHRADDKRRGGYGDNVVITVQENDGTGKRLMDIFNDRRSSLGYGKKFF